MKTLLSAFLFYMFIHDCAIAQQYDKVWVLGDPMVTLTFDNGTTTSGLLPDSTLQSFNTIADICDFNGNLLFYTNGVNVYNKQGNVMINGDSLSAPSEYYDQVLNGMPSREGVVILPMPGDSNHYYIFHYAPTDTLDIADNAGYESLNLYYSIVDIRQDGGLGVVIQKNVPLIQNKLLSYSRLAACRHANGRDWWVVKNAWHENIYYKFLLSPDGVQGPFIQEIGPLYGAENEQPAYAAFSPDGSKYASVTAYSYVVVMDFDRCSGLFSKPDSIYNNDSNNPITNPISGGANLTFSPNNRFLYVNTPIELNQYDLWSTQIHDSVRIQTDTEFYQMNIMQLAPNGKIYVSCWNGGSYAVHVINHPDSLGLACDFQFLSQPVLSLSPFALPYFPNFRLGALTGTCDTLTEIQAIEDAHPAFAIVTPNPASNHADIIYYTGSNTNNEAMLYDMNGRLIWNKSETGSSGNLSIDLSAIPAGVYVVKFTANATAIFNSKLIVIK